mgnify:CR=1 FL=1
MRPLSTHTDCLCYLVRRGDRVLMLPDPDDLPTVVVENPVGFLVTFHVPLDLGLPEVGVGPRSDVMLRTAVPEASVDEDRDPCCAEDEVRCPAEILYRSGIDSEAEAEPVHKRPDPQLRGCVASSVPLHGLSCSLGGSPGGCRVGSVLRGGHGS